MILRRCVTQLRSYGSRYLSSDVGNHTGSSTGGKDVTSEPSTEPRGTETPAAEEGGIELKNSGVADVPETTAAEGGIELKNSGVADVPEPREKVEIVEIAFDTKEEVKFDTVVKKKKKSEVNALDGLREVMPEPIAEAHADSSSSPQALEIESWRRVPTVPLPATIAESVDVLIEGINRRRNLMLPEDHTLESILENDDGNFFNVKSLFTLDDLFRCKVHLGHSIGCWNAVNRKHLYGIRNDMHLIDIASTEQHLWRALNVISHVAARKGNIVFACQRQSVKQIIETTAQLCGETAFTTDRWLHPKDTDYHTKGTFQAEEFDALKPDLVICSSVMNPTSGQMLLHCNKNLIPTIGILDSDVDPVNLTYVIPGNDDSTDALVLYHKLFGKAIVRAKKTAEVLAYEEQRQGTDML